MDERWLILAVVGPWLAAGALLVRMFGTTRPDEGRVRALMLGGTVVGAVAAALAFGAALARGPHDVVLGNWIRSGDWVVDVALRVDVFGALFAGFALVVTGAVGWFAGPYMHRETGFLRMYALLALFGGAMALLGLAGNVPLLFAAWEVGGLCSALLIGFYPERPSSPRAGVRAILTNRVGDIALIVAMAAMWSATGTVALSGLEALSGGAASLVVGGVLVAAAAKSGQLPFTSWVGRAVEGPTPTSALFYGSVMLAAGLALAARFADAFPAAPIHWAAVPIGLSTALYATLVAMAQADAKNGLVYRAVAGMGVGFALVGLGMPGVGLIVGLASGALRTAQMLLAPSMLAIRTLRPLQPLGGPFAARPALQVAASDRFWIEESTDRVGAAVLSAARSAERVERRVFERAAGSAALAVDVLGARAAQGDRAYVWSADGGRRTTGRGVVGRLAEGLATTSIRVEQKVVDEWVGNRLPGLSHQAGGWLDKVERVLQSPLWLMGTAAATVVIVLVVRSS
jgi:formate hydrogenlyase subunit 3/multisubunit Na+/H+ antiporter MnhD subunit